MTTVLKMETYEPPPSEPVITVVDTLPEHINALGHNLRDRDIQMAALAGLPPHRALWRLWRQSIMCKTILVEGEPVAAFGCLGIFLGRIGKPWLVTVPYAEEYPLKFVFRYRSELRKMLKRFLVLEDWVCVKDEKTVRLMQILGFKFEPPKLMNGIEFMRVTLERDVYDKNV